jgi:hypothetical protein
MTAALRSTPAVRSHRIVPWLLAVLSLLLPRSAASGSPHSLPGFDYVSPAPDSRYHKPETNVILRPSEEFDPASLQAGRTVRLSGDLTDDHPGALRLADDGRTILFRPSAPFLGGESVTCTVSGLLTRKGDPLPDARFTFQIAGLGAKLALAPLPFDEAGDDPTVSATATSPDFTADAAADSLPIDFPHIRGDTYGTPSPGVLFLATLRFSNLAHLSYLLMARDDGTPAFYRRLNGRGLDFKLQPNGRATYFDTSTGCFYALNAQAAVVDSFRCGNGYVTDTHELLLLPNGHALLMAYDPQLVDMSAVVPGGLPQATVTGLVIQELDGERDVVFQWRSWDHFQITDATRARLTAPAVDYVHGNSIDVDADGALLISSRHLDEITKISRETGAIVWRFGGKNNQFTFVNDPDRFFAQHDARRQASGTITLFDNGNGRIPLTSRAVEYRLDEEAMTATRVWEFRRTPNVFGFAAGSTQRLPSGNTLIGWGSASPAATEVTPDGTVVSELWLPDGLASYRARRHEWPPVREAELTVQPRSLNPDGGTRWISVVIELPEGVDASTVVAGSIRFQETLHPYQDAMQLADANGNGRPDILVKFDVAEVVKFLSPGANTVSVTGELSNGERFRGRADIVLLRGLGGGSKPGGALVTGDLAARVSFGSGDLVGPVGTSRGSGARSVVLEAFDLQGRRVHRWTALPDGEGRVAWNGAGNRGALPNGVYFVRRADARGRVVKVVIAR